MNEIILNTELRERLDQKIKTAFAEIVPQETWDKLVEERWQLFFHGREAVPASAANHYRSTPGVEAEAPRMIDEAIRQIVKEEIEDEIEAWRDSFRKSKEFGEAMNELLTSAQEKAAKTFLSEVASQIMSRALNSLHHASPMCCGNLVQPGMSCPACGRWPS